MNITSLTLWHLPLTSHIAYNMSDGKICDTVTSCILRLESDTGLTGWGEVCPIPHYLPAYANGVAPALTELAPVIFARDGLVLGAEGMIRAANMYLQGHEYAKSPLDLALWDLTARAAGLEPHLWIEAEQVCQASGPLLDARALAMPGAHNRQNLLMAVAVGLELGLSGEQMEAALRSFPGVPHRLERIRELDGVSWFNDSKATNYDAAEVALQALQGPLVVLAGGEAKQGDPRGWLAGLQREAAAVVLFGAARSPFEQLLQQAHYSGAVHSVDNLDQAVPLARQLAGQHGCRAVLLSPACASFDQFRDFEARGDHFRALVRAL